MQMYDILTLFEALISHQSMKMCPQQKIKKSTVFEYKVSYIWKLSFLILQNIFLYCKGWKCVIFLKVGNLMWFVRVL